MNQPFLNVDTFKKEGYATTEPMTLQGVIFKSLTCVLLVVLSAAWTWMKFYQSGGNPAAVQTWMWVGIIGGLIVAMATIFKPTWSPITAPLYAVLEGLFIGGISSILQAAYPGIVSMAVCGTFGTFFMMLFLYQSGIIRATERFKMGVVAATGGIAVVYLVSIVLGFFGVQVPMIYGSSWVGIGFSLVVVCVAALNFILDFDIIEQGVTLKAPKYMEWYASFALMVTMIWLYIEMLRLLSKINERR